MKIKPLILLPLLLALAACGVEATPLPIATPTQAALPPTPSPTAAQDRLDSFETVWRTMNERYFDPTFGGLDWDQVHDRYRPLVAAAQDDAAFYRLINQMLFELNVSHLLVAPPGEADQIEPIVFDEGSAGVDARLLAGEAVVTRVEPGSPAAQAGLRPGFILQTIDGLTIDQLAAERLTFRVPPFTERRERNQITGAIRESFYGAPGTEVSIVYVDANGASHQAQLVRQARAGKQSFMAELPPAFVQFETQVLDGDIGYVRFNGFLPPVDQEFRAALAEMADAPGLIIDIRGNPGGVFPVRKAVAEALFSERTLGWSYKSRQGVREVYFDPTADAYTGPVVVLVDVMSGSSSEEFAGAMQATGRATIVGERTAGVVLVGDVVQLPDGAIFMYPVEQTRTADGTVLEGRGVIPDLEVPLDRAALLQGTDSQLQAAIEYLQTQVAEGGRMEPRASDATATPLASEFDLPASGVTLHARVAGDPQSGRVLIAIHGGPGMSSAYMLDLEALAGGDFAVVTYDQRGTGRSTSPPADPSNYDLLDYVADLEAVREALGVEQVHLLGHSWGGLVAMRYATVHPARVKSLILMGSGAPDWGSFQAAQAHGAQRVAELQDQGFLPQTLTGLDDLLPAYFSDPGFERPAELRDLHYTPAAEQLTRSALGQFDFTADVARLEQPVLLLFGADDLFGLAMAEATRDALSAADLQFVLLDHCGHFWHECPDQFYSQLRAFLNLPATP
jgi:carboxyl-terminal processing protease